MFSFIKSLMYRKLCQRDAHMRRQGTVFGPSSNQEEVFSDLQMEQLISKVVEGYHATVFAYGQTGWEFGDDPLMLVMFVLKNLQFWIQMP